jgi:hypothetical protein
MCADAPGAPQTCWTPLGLGAENLDTRPDVLDGATALRALRLGRQQRPDDLPQPSGTSVCPIPSPTSGSNTNQVRPHQRETRSKGAVSQREGAPSSRPI